MKTHIKTFIYRVYFNKLNIYIIPHVHTHTQNMPRKDQILLRSLTLQTSRARRCRLPRSKCVSDCFRYSCIYIYTERYLNLNKDIQIDYYRIYSNRLNIYQFGHIFLHVEPYNKANCCKFKMYLRTLIVPSIMYLSRDVSKDDGTR